ncbi:putative B3 domain-containing protein Os03g0621600 [Olea europaea var. sylvestris]|uniref:putative B3 domain-containing protein Os03g0621600 n=1 Tax=Olea europaea var. sylvestris TaxID=158386 RepID=UPI000C1CE7BE|nr:putative B3 domain-containing protein Os03g0621600 [Olea europaea var. sylvestris]
MEVPHRFFRIITPPQNYNTRLRHQLGDTVRVTAYDGIIVTIRLERDNARIYFADGWEQFFDHHNLQDAHVLVFDYNGYSTFNMTIFDHSGLEVTYDFDVPEEYNVSHTDNPAFEITLTLHHNSHREICIPGWFSRYHLPRGLRSVQIHDSLRHNWELATNLRPNGLIRRMTIGWADFFREKELQMGDTCVFKLLNSEPPKFIVYKKDHVGGSLTRL